MLEYQATNKEAEITVETAIRKARIEITMHPEKTYDILKGFALELTKKRIIFNFKKDTTT